MLDTFDRARAVDARGAPIGAVPGLDFVRNQIRRRWPFLLVVVLPTLLVSLYFGFLAADQYQSEADFVVKTASQAESGGQSGMAQLLGMSGSMTGSQSESYSVGDYLISHDAVAALRKKLDLVAMFRRPEADWVSRLWYASPAAEDLLKYFRRQVTVSFSSDTGITSLTVRAFRPGDAQRIAELLLELGEARVNVINQRAYSNGLAVASDQLGAAEKGVADAQTALTTFRQSHGDIDPERSSTAQIQLVSEMRAQLATSRSQLASMTNVDPSSPQYIALAARVRALEGEMGSQAGRLTGAGHAIAPDLGTFEELRVHQDFASKRYEAAAAALDTARQQLLKQQLYVMRDVEPNLPEKSLYPRRWLIICGVFIGLLLVYGIGWLIFAGVKEHGH